MHLPLASNLNEALNSRQLILQIGHCLLFIVTIPPE